MRRGSWIRGYLEVRTDMLEDGVYWAKEYGVWTGVALLTTERWKDGHDVQPPRRVWTWHNTGQVFTPTAIGPRIPVPKDDEYKSV